MSDSEVTAAATTTTATTTATGKKSRARKTSAVPTRIYSFRVLPPITEQARVEDQYRLAAQYRNALVEVEHKLRADIREVQLAHPTLGPALRAFEEANAMVETVYDELRAAKSGVKEPDLTEPRAKLSAAKEVRRSASAALKEARRNVADKESLVAAYQAARETAKVRRREKRTDFSGRGLRHGAYSRVEDSVQRAAASTKRELRFERYDGSGSIGTQLLARKHKDDPADAVLGLTLDELLSAADTRIRLGPPGALDARPRSEVTACVTPSPSGSAQRESWEAAFRLCRNLRRHAARTWVDLRIGSNEDRSPIFARFPVTLHRLPPKDCVIKWAHIVRHRIGHRLEWRLQLTLESRTFERPSIAMGEGICAVNLGWRRILDDQNEIIGLRAGYVVDQNGVEREIRVPDYIPSTGERRSYPALSAIGKFDDLARIRDQALERAQLSLSAWLVDRKGIPPEWEVAEVVRPDGTMPRPMAERLRGYSAWKAAWKLARFIDAWKTRRVPGDELIFEAMTAWAKQDRHLETWQSTARDRWIAHRRETWRVIATDLARKYALILVGESKLTDIDGWERAAPEDGDPSEGRVQRRMARVAAPGELLGEIVKAAAKTGAEVRRVDESHATQTCASCGSKEPWNARPSIDHTCGACGRTWDQDANHCRNLLLRDGRDGTAPMQHEGSVPGSQIDQDVSFAM